MAKMNRRQLRALIQESMRIGYELDGPRSEFYDDGGPEDDEAGLRFMSPRGRAPMPYAVDDSQDAMDMDLQLVPSDDYEGMGRLMRSQGREMPHHHDDDMMMERNEIRKMIQAIMVETSKVVPAAAGATVASVGIPGMAVGAIVAYLWATDQLGDVEAIAKDLMKKGTTVGQLWMRLDPEVQEAAIDLANAASNLPRAANEKIKNTTVEILEKATAALTMD